MSQTSGTGTMDAPAGASTEDADSPVVYHKNPDGSVVVTMFMSEKGFEFLEGLARDADAELKDVIGRALVLYRDARKAIEQGKSVGVTSDAESLEVRFVKL